MTNEEYRRGITRAEEREGWDLCAVPIPVRWCADDGCRTRLCAANRGEYCFAHGRQRQHRAVERAASVLCPRCGGMAHGKGLCRGESKGRRRP